MSFTAEFGGWCGQCEERISPGDHVEYVDGALQHVSCSPKIERPTETCPNCWLIKPCECEVTS